MIRHSIKTPFPVDLAHLYSFERGDDVVLFDAGPYTMDAIGYARTKLPLERLKYVFITHCHADHYGLMDFFDRETDAELYISKYDAVKFEKLDLRIKKVREFIGEMNFPLNSINALEKGIVHIKKSTPFPKNYKILEDSGDLLESLDLSYIRCPGHSQSDIVYLYEDYAVTGDVIISNVFTTPMLDVDFDTFDNRFNNYRAFCESIKKLKTIESRRFLPGHYEAVALDQWVDFYVRKLIDRTMRIKGELRRSGVYKVVESVISTPSKIPILFFIKTSEIVFMSDFLKETEILEQVLDEIGLVDRFSEDFKLLRA